MGIRTLAPAVLVAGVMAMAAAQYVKGGSGSATTRDHDKHVVCYWGTWSTYRTSHGKFTVDNLDPNLCTHIIYSFAKLDTATGKIESLDPWLDLGEGGHTGKRGFKNTTDLKRRNRKLKVTLAIGGWNEGSVKYSKMAKDPQKRATFVKSVVQMLKEYNFDGLDLDWEYPGKRGGDPADKANFVLLVKELKAAFANYGFILTAALGAAPGTIEVAYDVPELYKYLDLVHIMAYDYHGSWDEKTGHNAPLRAKPGAVGNDLDFTVESTWKTLMAKGAVASKTVMGVPFYGRSFNLINPHDARMGARATKTGFSGPYIKENGFLGYNEICEMLSEEVGDQQEWTREWDDYSAAPFAYNGIKWVGYDDEDSIGKKVQFAMGKGMAGIMVWSVDTDDFLGKCTGQRFPLLSAINEYLVKTEAEATAAATKATSVGYGLTLTLIAAMAPFIWL